MTETPVLNPFQPSVSPPLLPLGGTPAPPLLPPGSTPAPVPPPPLQPDYPPAWEGPVGPQGPAGPPGPAGPQGSLGPPGPVGPAGPQGDQGVQGVPGGAPSWQGGWSATIDYASNDAVAYQGGSYYAAGDPALGVAPPSAPWQQMAAKGDTGPPGPTGPTGATGPQGTTGATGAQGDPGPKGDTGSPGATGAQGPIGATGSQGPQGNPGPTGAAGPTGPGVAVGGTTAQVLTKTSATDFATNWQTPFSQTTADARYLQLTGGTLSGALLTSTYTEIPEIATPATPAAGKIRIYAKSDHGLYMLDSTGVERRLDVVTLEGMKSYA